MRQVVTTILLWFSAVGCGLMAGVYFAFSTFVMTSLARVAPPAGIAAMNSINVEIVRSLFMPVFIGTTLAAAVLAGLAIFNWSGVGSSTMLAGSVFYVIGMFAITAIFNVPLNDALAAADPTRPETVSLWARYIHDWTYWNHIRTIASVAASTLFIIVLAIR